MSINKEYLLIGGIILAFVVYIAYDQYTLKKGWEEEHSECASRLPKFEWGQGRQYSDDGTLEKRNTCIQAKYSSKASCQNDTRGKVYDKAPQETYKYSYEPTLDSYLVAHSDYKISDYDAYNVDRYIISCEDDGSWRAIKITPHDEDGYRHNMNVYWGY